ncbi:hypothetical protein PCE1_003248 [Barthelona sp. PCE]
MYNCVKSSLPPATSFFAKKRAFDLEKLNPISFRRYTLLRRMSWVFLSIITLGIVNLLGYWFPTIRFIISGKRCTESTEFNPSHVKYRDEQGEIVVEQLFYNIEDQNFFLNHRFRKYFYNSETNEFLLEVYDYFTSDTPTSLDEGLSPSLRKMHALYFGTNSFHLQPPGFLRMLITEILTPFYVFQILACVLWAVDEYLFYACCILLLALFSVGTAMYSEFSLHKKLKDLISPCPDVEILSKKQWAQVAADEIVAGDVVRLSKGTVPADIIIMRGSLVVNEAVLTGEGFPIRKVYKKDNPTRIFAGTDILTLSDDFLGIVERTGFRTMKGRMLLTLRFQSITNKRFFNESLKFFIGLGLIAIAGAVVAYSLLDGLSPVVLFIRCADLFTIVMPPSLPSVLTVGTSIAISRLKKKGVLVLRPSKLNETGFVSSIFFDKTGTLTEDELKFSGWSVGGISSADFSNIPHNMRVISGLCHSLYSLDGTLGGDFIDIKMFEKSGFRLLGSEGSQELYDTVKKEKFITLRNFDFTSENARHLGVFYNVTKRMVVIVLKGAPERLAEVICERSIPVSFEEYLTTHSFHSRVLGAATASFHVENIDDAWEYVDIPREELEAKCHFAGFMLFANALKPSSMNTVIQLKRHGFVPSMITGDAAATAVTTAVSLGMIERGKLFCSRLEPDNKVLFYNMKAPSEVIEWGDVIDAGHNCVITGNCVDFANESIMRYSRVFARCSPEQKQAIVMRHRECCFVGDGANDCLALNAASIGISVSQVDSSAAATFTTTGSDPQSVLTILREGQCSLVTSIAAFKFLILYSLFQFMTVCFSYYRNELCTNFMFLFVDLGLAIPISLISNYTHPSDHLSDDRPPSSLLSKSIFLSLFGHALIAVGSMTFAYFSVSKEVALTTAFYHCCFMCWALALALNHSQSFRKPFYTNDSLVFLMIIELVMICLLVFNVFTDANILFKLSILDMSEKLLLCVTAFVASVLMIVFERVVVQKVHKNSL